MIFSLEGKKKRNLIKISVSLSDLTKNAKMGGLFER